MIDVKAVFDHFSIDYKTGGKNVGINDINIDCPYCNSDKHLSVHKQKGTPYCWVCDMDGNKPSIATIIKELTGFEFKDIIPVIKEHSDDDYFTQDNIKISRVCRLPAECQDFQYPKDQYNFKMAVQYLCKRNINAEKAKKYNLKFCPSGPFHHRIIIPVYKDKKLVNYIGRTYGKSEQRYKNCYTKDCNIRLRDTLYNIDNFAGDKIRLVEGVFDAMEMDDHSTLAIFKSKLSINHTRLIIGLKAKELSIVLDPDAYAKAITIAENLSPFFKKVCVIKLPDNMDVSELGRDKVLELEDKTKPIYY